MTAKGFGLSGWWRRHGVQGRSVQGLGPRNLFLQIAVHCVQMRRFEEVRRGGLPH